MSHSAVWGVLVNPNTFAHIVINFKLQTQSKVVNPKNIQKLLVLKVPTPNRPFFFVCLSPKCLGLQMTQKIDLPESVELQLIRRRRQDPTGFES